MNDNRTLPTSGAPSGTRHGSAEITLPSDTEILITRRFDAPAHLVFEAITTPALVQRWWGFETSEWLVCEVDLRVGGTWRYVIRDSGTEVGFHGEYLELDAPHRMVSTEVFEGFPDAGSINTVTLDEVDGVTTMSTLIKHELPEHRDAQLASGMESGMQVSYDRLEDLVRRR
jgi:uncharacterized protein YndB with AHSA1/START domain